MVIQEKTFPRWKNQTQIQTAYTWCHTTMGIRLLGHIYTSYQLAMHYRSSHPFSGTQILPKTYRLYYYLPLSKIRGRCIYGTNAAHNLFQLLSSGLQHNKLGFRQSEIYPCVLFRKDAIIITWVDECIILVKTYL